MIRKCLSITVLFSFLFYPYFTKASSFIVKPTKLFLDVRTKTTIVRVVNNGEEKAFVQLDAKLWSQDETGNDRYDDTGDIIFFPKIASIEKGKERIIRVGYRGKPSNKEKAYRLFIEELPVSKPGEMALKFAIRLSLPVFIAPVVKREEKKIEGVALREGKLHLTVKNGGSAHFIVSKIKATGLDSSGTEIFSKDMGGWYVLSGVSKTYVMNNIQEDECAKAEVIKIVVDIEKLSVESSVDVDAAQCKKPKKSEKPVKKASVRQPGNKNP